MKILLQFLGIVSCTAKGNILLKIASLRISKDASIWDRLLAIYTILGLSFFVTGVIFYISVLGSMPLSKDQSFASGQFILTVLTAFIVFREQISVAQWIGMGLFGIEITLVGIK